jgi:hypothetical protein
MKHNKLALALYQHINSSSSRHLSRIHNFCNSSKNQENVLECIYNFNINKDKDIVKDNVLYFDTNNINDPSNLGISVWQGITKYQNNLLIVGTSQPSATAGQGIIFIGDITCNRGTIYELSVPSAEYTSVYGPRYNPMNDLFSFVGSYMLPNDPNTYGFLYRGSLNSFTDPSKYILNMNNSSSDYTITFTHSTDGDFAVGNSGNITSRVTLSWLYNINNGTYTTISYPGSKTTTTYGIIKNRDNSYTIVGGYSTSRQVGITEIYTSSGVILPIQYAYIADFTYDGTTVNFYNWTNIQYKNQYLAHFQGISSTNNPNIYTISADVIGINNEHTGFFLKIERQNNGFKESNWTPINYGDSINSKGLTTSNSVIDNKVVGLFVGQNNSFQAFQSIITL